MAEQSRSFVDMFNQFAQQLKLPRVDTEQLIEQHRKNIDALARSAQAASAGATSLATKQSELFEDAIREISAMVRDLFGNSTMRPSQRWTCRPCRSE